MTRSQYSKFRLSYLDGLRGFASLYVLIYHIYLMTLQVDDLPKILVSLSSKVLKHGLFSVTVFIVLSGYCLMLPVVRSQEGNISGSLWNYFYRRARRILPTYYAALILCLLLSALILATQKFTDFSWHRLTWDLFSPYFSATNVILHFFLIHNLTLGRGIYSINSPMWSVAVEWQIYFLFPLLLIPLWRRWNWFSLLAIAFIIGLIPHYLFQGALDSSRPWFIGSFALGMLAADIGFSQQPNLIKLQQSIPWGLLSIVFLSLALITESRPLGLDEWVCTTFTSLAAACLIIYCTHRFILTKELPQIVRVLDSQAAIALGGFSYSLYLTHAPILTLVRHYLLSLQLSPTQFVLFIYLIGTISCILFAYLFHLLFERPFIK